MPFIIGDSDVMLLTSGQIAEQVNEDRDRVSYALRKARVQPIGRAGMVRLFGPEAVEKVRAFFDSRSRKQMSRSA